MKGQRNTSKVIFDTWFSRIGRFIGWAGVVFWGMVGIVGLSDLLSGKELTTAGRVLPFFCLGLAALHAWMTAAATRVARLLRDFHLYCAVLAREPDKSVPALAQTLQLPREKVTARVGEMCRRRYFNGYLDHAREQMVFSTPENAGPAFVACCPGCGARNAVSVPGTLCRYCGAPLSGPDQT